MRLRDARSAAALAALGLTVAAAVAALGPVAPSGTTVVVDAGPTVVLRADAGAPDPVAPTASYEVGRHELELSGLSALAAQRGVAGQRAGEASALLESVRTARVGAVEQATRAAERDRIATAPPRELGQILAAERGFAGDQWSCLDSLWQRESNWNPSAENPSSGAYGIPQSLPGSKMATVAADWRTNPATQITWGLDYIVDRYGTPCGAWAHSETNNWY